MPLKETERTSFLLTFQAKKLPSASLSPPEFRYSKKLEIPSLESSQYAVAAKVEGGVEGFSMKLTI